MEVLANNSGIRLWVNDDQAVLEARLGSCERVVQVLVFQLWPRYVTGWVSEYFNCG